MTFCSLIVLLRKALQGITPQSTTGRAPAELFLKRELRTRFSLLCPDFTTNVRDKQEHQANVHDPVKIQNREFKENDIVSVRNYFGTRKWEQGKVTKNLEDIGI